MYLSTITYVMDSEACEQLYEDWERMPESTTRRLGAYIKHSTTICIKMLGHKSLNPDCQVWLAHRASEQTIRIC